MDLSSCAQPLTFTVSLTCQQSNKAAGQVKDHHAFEKSPWMAAFTELSSLKSDCEKGGQLAAHSTGARTKNILKNIHKSQTGQ